MARIHSVSKEMHHKLIGFPWNPGSRLGDPYRVAFYHENLKQVAKSWKIQGYVMF